jgi:hypothetical protein
MNWLMQLPLVDDVLRAILKSLDQSYSSELKCIHALCQA